MTREIQIKVNYISERLSDISLPEYMTEGSSGLDLRAAMDEPITIRPMQRALVPTGIQLSIPPGYEGQVRPRSGLAVNYGITVLNTPGTIDSDYRGEVKVILINLGSADFTLNRGDRIAQIVFACVVKAQLSLGSEMDSTERGVGGFGHSGK